MTKACEPPIQAPQCVREKGPPLAAAPAQSEEAVMVLKALADPNRLRIFFFLMQGDSCNCELQEKLGLQPNLLSHHLRVLREAGLVTSRRDAVDARWIYYAVDRKGAGRWRDWFCHLLDPARIRERAVLCGPEGVGGTKPAGGETPGRD